MSRRFAMIAVFCLLLPTLATADEPKPVSGRQEYLENLVNRFV